MECPKLPIRQYILLSSKLPITTPCCTGNASGETPYLILMVESTTHEYITALDRLASQMTKFLLLIGFSALFISLECLFVEGSLSQRSILF